MMRALVAGVGAYGDALCRRLARDAADRGDELRLAVWATEPVDGLLTGLDAELLVLPGDPADPRAPAELVARAVEFCGGLDALFCNTGTSGEPPSLLDAALEDWDRFAAINVRAPLLLGQAAYPALRRSRGAIAIMADLAGTQPDPTHGLSSASRAGAIMVARMLSQDWAPDGIQVNSVSPDGGTVDAEDVASTVAFLLGPDSGYVTGEDFVLRAR